MAIYLLLVLLLHTKYNLTWHNSFIRELEMQIWIQSERCGVLKNVSSDLFLIDSILHVPTCLIYAQQR